jgi:GH15 family glucan-1,4-alpha-glucosidase
VRNVERNWGKPDRGIWEYREKKNHFVFSKVLCWVAADRGIKIARILGQRTYVREWSRLRDAIRDDIHAKGWNPRVKAFTQSYGSDDLDAANLQMEPHGFIDAGDPRWVSTVEQTHERLCRDGLMYRYRNEDDFGTPSSSFTICTFWMIKALFKIGRESEARELFDTVLGYSNHLGLFSEDIHFRTKALLGNFPQGYSHLALVDTAMTLAGDTPGESQRLRNLFLE